MRVTYMISLNHDVPAQSITKLHAYKFAAYPRNPAQTRTFPRNATRKFGLRGAAFAIHFIRCRSREAIMQTVAFKAGDTIIAQGDKGDAAFLIVTGSVEVSIGQGKKARTLGVLNAGEVFGEMCLIEPGPRSATVNAATDVECLAMSYEEFIKVIEDQPERSATFMKELVKRLRRMNELMESVGSDRRGLRGIIRDWRKTVASSDIVCDAADLWKMLW